MQYTISFIAFFWMCFHRFHLDQPHIHHWCASLFSSHHTTWDINSLTHINALNAIAKAEFSDVMSLHCNTDKIIFVVITSAMAIYSIFMGIFHFNWTKCSKVHANLNRGFPDKQLCYRALVRHRGSIRHVVAHPWSRNWSHTCWQGFSLG